MNALLAIAIIGFAVAITVTLMLVVRHFAAPAGGSSRTPIAQPASSALRERASPCCSRS
jgi:hypothetical protein